MEEGSQFHFSSVHEDGVKGERPTLQHPGDDVLQIEVRVSLYEPLESLGRVKTFRQQVGVQGQENRKIPLLWSG